MFITTSAIQRKTVTTQSVIRRRKIMTVKSGGKLVNPVDAKRVAALVKAMS
jgi:predicted TIM-barrel enzyme